MAKTELTLSIERALKYYRPVTTGGIKLNTARGRTTAFEVPVECGTTHSGMIDCVRINEYFKLNIGEIEGTPKILITCYEIKVTKTDFKSKNGHNFIGNLNYYVIPKELYTEVQHLVPEGIGIILFNKYDLRRKVESKFNELTDSEQKWLMMSVMKRIRFGKEGND